MQVTRTRACVSSRHGAGEESRVLVLYLSLSSSSNVSTILSGGSCTGLLSRRAEDRPEEAEVI